MAKKVIVLGAGIGGLSAAHELVKRGFAVEVYEASPYLGGKARSQFVPGTGTGGRADLPGEHGFRFYPNFYKHLIATMADTPLSDGDGNVADNLIDTTEAAVAAHDGDNLHRFWRRLPPTPLDWLETYELFFKQIDVDDGDVALLVYKIFQYYTSCDKRRELEYEKMSWWSFLGGPGYSDKFQKYLRAIPRTMVAMDSKVGSARTIGTISMQLLLDMNSVGNANDRTMNGPTSTQWLDHWERHLLSLGVTIHRECKVNALHFDGTLIGGADIEGKGLVTGDYYVAGLPLDIIHGLITDDMAAFDEGLEKLRSIDLDAVTGWMVGVQCFLKDDVPLVPGHVFFPDSPWALTAISQAQFWQAGGEFRNRFGDGSVGGIISVDVSDFDTPGLLLGKRARDCTETEIAEEVWEQLKRAINPNSAGLSPVLTDDNLHSVHVCDEIEFPTPAAPPIKNHAVLLVHPPGSWAKRPEAATQITNFVLASDYVRTYTDLATMEGANEAARRACNAIFEREGFPRHRLARVWPLEEPGELDRAKSIDQTFFDRGLRHPLQTMHFDLLFPLVGAARKAVRATGWDSLDDRLDEVIWSRLIRRAFRSIGVSA